MLKQLQQELKEWTDKNFGERPAWHAVLGMQEELGELSHAFLKKSQKIRMSQEHDENIRDSLADLVIFVCDFFNIERIDLEETIQTVWDKVKRRDYSKDKELQ